MVCRFVSGVPSGRTNNYPESGRGLGHVTLTIFGSTVGYPSDSLASCFNIVAVCHFKCYKFVFFHLIVVKTLFCVLVENVSEIENKNSPLQRPNAQCERTEVKLAKKLF